MMTVLHKNTVASSSHTTTCRHSHEGWILCTKKLLKALLGFRHKSRITAMRSVCGTRAGIKCEAALRCPEALPNHHLPWSGGSCTGRWAACSRGLCQALKHREQGTRYSATRKVTDVRLSHTHTHTHYFSSPLDRAVSPLEVSFRSNAIRPPNYYLSLKLQ